MELNNTEILFLSELLIKMLKNDIQQKNNNERNKFSEEKFNTYLKNNVFDEQVLDNQFKEFTEPEKRKRGRPFGSFKKCNIPSER